MDQRPQSLVVIGASAGGIKALLDLVEGLPTDLEAAILVVVHIGSSRSVLPQILTRTGALKATAAEDGEPLHAGRIYVAPPDYHLLVQDGHIALSHGPKENHTRPAIDPLFRSAARSYGPRVIGVVLSGALSDGTSGLLMIKARGGLAIVQDPEDAIIEGMPASALRLVNADYVLPAREIGQMLPELVASWTPGKAAITMGEQDDDAQAIISEDFQEQREDRRVGRMTMFTCPDCGGTLWQLDDGSRLRYQCHVGHAWGPEVLLTQKSEELEAALWAGVRLFKERATLTHQIAARMRETGQSSSRADALDEEADVDEQRADAIRNLLNTPMGAAPTIAAQAETDAAED